MKNSFAYPIVFMALVTAVFVATLSFVNYITIDKISFNENVDLQKKILYVFDIDYDESNPEKINETFNEYIFIEKEDSEFPVYRGENQGEIVGYAYPVGGSGLWGTINAYICLSKDLDEIIGLEFISQEETPGLGGRIDELEFKEQFRNIAISSEASDYIIYRPATGGNVDAISGATLTSQAVADFLNKDLLEIKGGLQ